MDDIAGTDSFAASKRAHTPSPFEADLAACQKAEQENAKTGAPEYLSRHGFDKDHLAHPAPAPTGPGSWTLFVNLTGNLNLKNTALKIDDQLQQQALIESTRGKPTKIIVQTYLSDDARLNSTSTTEPPPAPISSDPKHTLVARYEISNGEKRLLSLGKSQGMAADLKALLGSDPNAMKAEHVALFNQAHGGNVSGFEGDSGGISLANFQSVVAQSLKQQGRKSLDVVDLAACEMSSPQSFSRLSTIAKNVISSEEVQFSFWRNTDHLLSPIAKPIADIVAQTNMQPSDSGRQILADTREACQSKTQQSPTEGAYCAANTLGLYDTTSAPALDGALNHLGISLNRIAGSRQSMGRIADMIQSLPPVFVQPDSTSNVDDQQHKDLGMFVYGLEALLDEKAIPDTAGGALRSAIGEVKSAMGKVVVDNFNSTTLKPEIAKDLKTRGLPDKPLSGMSIFLPTPMSSLPQRYAENIRHELEANSRSSPPNIPKDFQCGNLNLTLKQFTSNLKDIKDELENVAPELESPQSSRTVGAFLKSTNNLLTWLNSDKVKSGNPSEDEYTSLKSQFGVALRALINDSKTLKALSKLEASDAMDDLSSEFVPSQPGWNQFLNRLARQ